MLKTATIATQSKEMETLMSTILDLQMRSMRHNMLFYNSKEEQEETCPQNVQKALTASKYESQLMFNSVHRTVPRRV